ncbi:MAG TPA: hypothetical protein VFR22_01845 [Nocardioidaceae bacterium]|nr:hypothetical protein [Nocardioidaceae bacterium]
MNLDDLRRELQDRAGEPGDTPISDRLAGVRSKVAAARRRRVVASGVAAIASLAVIGVVSTQLVSLGRDDLNDSDLAHMPHRLNGDQLKEASYNNGASELSWTAELKNLDVLTRATCVLPDGVVPPEPDDTLLLEWTINGAATYTVTCGTEDHPGIGTNGPATPAEWRALGVTPGAEIDVDAFLVQGGSKVDVPGAQFGVALYEKTGVRAFGDGVELTKVLDVGDDRYELVRWKTRPLTEGKRTLRLRTPVSDGSIAIVYGWQSDMPTAAYKLRRDGESVATGYGGSIQDPLVIDGDTEHLWAFEANGSTVDGVLVLAYYELKD